MEEEYKGKSYKLLVTWIIGFLALIIVGSIVVTTYFSEGATKIIFLLFFLALLMLFYIIYKTENIYWINGISYEEAKSTTSERRKKFAVSHLKTFSKATAVYGAYCIIGIIINTSIFTDTTIFLILSIVAAVKTIPIKL